jgi:hypothetical protein
MQGSVAFIYYVKYFLKYRIVYFFQLIRCWSVGNKCVHCPFVFSAVRKSLCRMLQIDWILISYFTSELLRRYSQSTILGFVWLKRRIL